MTYTTELRVHIVVGKATFSKSNHDITLYGVYDDRQFASTVAYHAAIEQNKNPFLHGTLQHLEGGSYAKDRAGFLREIKPQIFTLNLNDPDCLVRIKLGSFNIENAWREKWENPEL